MTGWTADRLRALDAEDPLALFRDRFALPEAVVYLAGHVLGPPPAATAAALARTVEAGWGRDLVAGGDLQGPIEPAVRAAAAIARILAADAHEIGFAPSRAVGLFELLAAALDLRPDRTVLLVERGGPSVGREVAHGLVELLRGEVELRLLEEDEPLAEALDERVACLVVHQVDERTGRLQDLASLAAAAHEVGALVLADLTHSAGALPIDLREAHVDFALGCGSRHLCGGPGAPALLFVAERHRDTLGDLHSGRIRRAAPVGDQRSDRPVPGFGYFLAAPPSVFALEALRVGAELVAEADLALVREKALRMGAAFQALVLERLEGYGLELASPADPEARGAWLAFAHPEAQAILDALVAEGVVADFSRPNLLRFGFSALFNRYEEIWIAAEGLARLVLEHRFEHAGDRRFGRLG